MSESDHIYYNAVIASGSDKTRLFEANYVDNRSQPIIENPQNYKMSVINMVVPGQLIPIRIISAEKNPIYNPFIQGFQNVDMTPYRVTIFTDTNEISEPVIWIPQTSRGIKPIKIPETAVDTVHAQYYSLYNHSWMINLFNTAFDVAFEKLKKAQPSLESTMAPLFRINRDGIISFIVQSSYKTDNIQIGFNGKGYRFFSGIFPTQFEVSSLNKIIINYDVMHKVNGFVPFGYGECVMNVGDYNGLTAWQSEGGFRSIELVSNTIPAQNELINNQNPVNGTIQATGSSGFDKILVDFRVDTPVGNEVIGGNIIYQPSAQYRYISFMGSSGSLTNMTFNLRWRDNYGNVYPINILEGMTATVKFLFEKIY